MSIVPLPWAAVDGNIQGLEVKMNQLRCFIKGWVGGTSRRKSFCRRFFGRQDFKTHVVKQSVIKRRIPSLMVSPGFGLGLLTGDGSGTVR